FPLTVIIRAEKLSVPLLLKKPMPFTLFSSAGLIVNVAILISSLFYIQILLLGINVSSVEDSSSFQNLRVGIPVILQSVLSQITPFPFTAYQQNLFILGMARQFPVDGGKVDILLTFQRRIDGDIQYR